MAGVLELRFRALGPLLDALQLMAPVALEGAGPLVEGTNRMGVGPVHAMTAVAADVDEADLAQDAEMLGDRGLIEADGGNDLTHLVLAHGKKREDLPPAGLGDGVEGVGSGGCSCHGETIHSYIGICQGYFRVFVTSGEFWFAAAPRAM
jgi:hypothetical protein